MARSCTLYGALTFFPAPEPLCVGTIHLGSTLSTLLGEYSMNIMGLCAAITSWHLHLARVAVDTSLQAQSPPSDILLLE